MMQREETGVRDPVRGMLSLGDGVERMRPQEGELPGVSQTQG